MASIKRMECDCGGRFKQVAVPYQEFLLDALECERCKKQLFDLEQYKHVLRLREANQQVHASRKIIKVGSSIAALLPKKLERYGVKEGMVSEICVLGPRSLQLKFNKDLF